MPVDWEQVAEALRMMADAIDADEDWDDGPEEPDAEEPDAEEPDAEELDALRVSVREEARKLLTSGQREAVVEILKRYGGSVSSVPVEDLQDCLSDLESIA